MLPGSSLKIKAENSKTEKCCWLSAPYLGRHGPFTTSVRKLDPSSNDVDNAAEVTWEGKTSAPSSRAEKGTA